METPFPLSSAPGSPRAAAGRRCLALLAFAWCGAFVIVHGDTLDRETDGDGPVEALSLAEVKRLQKRYRDGTLSGQPAAALEELLAAGKGRILFKADAKPGVMDHFHDLARLVAALGMEEQLLDPGVRMFHAADPEGLLRDLSGETVPF